MGKKTDKLFYFPSRLMFFLERLKARCFYKLFFGRMGKGSAIVRPELIFNPSHIFIGDGVMIHSNARILCMTDYKGEKFSQNFDPKVEIGDGTGIQQGLYISCAESVKIGKRVSMSQYIAITDIDHDYEDVGRPVYDQPLLVNKVVIGDDSFVGSGAVILRGTKIGKHCIIGANSVVKGEFPDYSVIAGVPAKVIKKLK
jgi:acetyltransferase-like isoleucine patch superfamily enzyme